MRRQNSRKRTQRGLHLPASKSVILRNSDSPRTERASQRLQRSSITTTPTICSPAWDGSRTWFWKFPSSKTRTWLGVGLFAQIGHARKRKRETEMALLSVTVFPPAYELLQICTYPDLYLYLLVFLLLFSCFFSFSCLFFSFMFILIFYVYF